MSPARQVVVGVGNRFRRDDAAGLEVADLLRAHAPDGVEILTLEGEPTVLLELLADADLVVLVDAVAAGGEPGEVRRFDATDEAVPGNVFGASTHAFGLGETIELARMLGRLNARVVVYGITGEEFVAGEGLSPSVTYAVGAAADAVLRELAGSPGSNLEQEGANHA